VVRINNRYYLYKVKSVWDPRKGRARKVTEKYLGKITPEGLIKPKHKRVLEGLKEITVKEFGASHFVYEIASDTFEPLKKHYPAEWKEMAVFAIVRLFHSSPLKNVSHYYVTSHLSDVFPGAKVSPKSLSSLLRSLGERRGKMVKFMKDFVIGSEFMVFDLTHVFSFSENVISATLGHNSKGEYIPQINLALIFSLDEKLPSFFRLVPGSVRDVSLIPISLKEAGVKKAVIIGDKGLYSEDNVKFFEKEKLEYILPLKRDSSLIDYAPIGDKRKLDGYFIFEKRVIWYYEKHEDKRIIVFLDEKLKAEEEKDFISYIEGKRLSIEEYYERQFKMGTIAVITNSPFPAQRVFELLKGRVEIEVLFDTFKNLLNADRTYMREDTRLQGWMLINFISLILYYKLYRILVEKGLLKKFSPRDVILHLSRIYKLKIEDKWMLSEIPKTSRTLIKKLQVKLHIT
jgi:transposase